MADGVDHHQRALPAIGLVFAPDPAVLEIPMRQLFLEPLLDLGVVVGSLRRCHRADLLKQCGSPRTAEHIPEASSRTMEAFLPRSKRRAQGCGFPRPGVGNHHARACISAFSIRADGARGRSALRACRSTGRRTRLTLAARRERSRSPGPRASGPRAISGRRRKLRFAEAYALTRRGGDPAPCRPRLRHPACACRRLGFCRARAASASTRKRSPRGSAAARARASASPPSRKEVPCSMAVRARGELPQLVSRAARSRRLARAPDLRSARRNGLAGAERDRGLRSRCRISRERDRRTLTGAIDARRAARRLPRATSPFLRAGRLFAGQHGRLFRAAAGRRPIPAQRVAAVLDWLRGQGFTGLGQSSWGPTGFAFVAVASEGQTLLGRSESACPRARPQLRAGARPQRGRHHRDGSGRNSR